MTYVLVIVVDNERTQSDFAYIQIHKISTVITFGHCRDNNGKTKKSNRYNFLFYWRLFLRCIRTD